MGPEKMKDPGGWAFRTALLLLGSVIALNMATAYLQPLLPWIIGSVAVASAVWVMVGIIRWRRNKW